MINKDKKRLSKSEDTLLSIVSLIAVLGIGFGILYEVVKFIGWFKLAFS